MPTYNYKCLSCEKDFVVFQKMSEKPISTCTFCCSDKVEKLITSGAGLIFKGSGFYLTDYKNEPKKEQKNKAKIKDKE